MAEDEEHHARRGARSARRRRRRHLHPEPRRRRRTRRTCSRAGALTGRRPGRERASMEGRRGADDGVEDGASTRLGNLHAAAPARHRARPAELATARREDAAKHAEALRITRRTPSWRPICSPKLRRRRRKELERCGGTCWTWPRPQAESACRRARRRRRAVRRGPSPPRRRRASLHAAERDAEILREALRRRTPSRQPRSRSSTSTTRRRAPSARWRARAARENATLAPSCRRARAARRAGEGFRRGGARDGDGEDARRGRRRRSPCEASRARRALQEHAGACRRRRMPPSRWTAAWWGSCW